METERAREEERGGERGKYMCERRFKFENALLR
jgi:hypothetical protein